MAIGMAKLFGFDFDANFDHPYLSASLTEFWRRWHISLGRWFRDYVYIPLGGSRVSTPKCIRNLLIVWILTGLWHGASWTFVAWGLYHGILLLLEKYPLKGILAKTPSTIRHILTLLAVIVGWVLFFSPDFSSAIFYLGRMFGAGSRAFWGFHRKILFCSKLEASCTRHSWLRPMDSDALPASRVLAAQSWPCAFCAASDRHFPALRPVYDERHLSILPLCSVLSEVIP